jgi:hypothetical protein
MATQGESNGGLKRAQLAQRHIHRDVEIVRDIVVPDRDTLGHEPLDRGQHVRSGGKHSRIGFGGIGRKHPRDTTGLVSTLDIVERRFHVARRLPDD